MIEEPEPSGREWVMNEALGDGPRDRDLFFEEPIARMSLKEVAPL